MFVVPSPYFARHHLKRLRVFSRLKIRFRNIGSLEQMFDQYLQTWEAFTRDRGSNCLKMIFCRKYLENSFIQTVIWWKLFHLVSKVCGNLHFYFCWMNCCLITSFFDLNIIMLWFNDELFEYSNLKFSSYNVLLNNKNSTCNLLNYPNLRRKFNVKQML